MATLAIEAVQVTFGGVRALHDVSLAAESGLVTGLIGPNGAGKTTLFNVVCGLLPPDAGRVRLGGHDLLASRPTGGPRRASPARSSASSCSAR